jgi:hypothetical protein
MRACHTVDVADAARKSLTILVRLTGVRRFSFRLKLACKILSLAGFVSPVPMRVDIENEARA